MNAKLGIPHRYCDFNHLSSVVRLDFRKRSFLAEPSFQNLNKSRSACTCFVKEELAVRTEVAEKLALQLFVSAAQYNRQQLDSHRASGAVPSTATGDSSTLVFPSTIQLGHRTSLSTPLQHHFCAMEVFGASSDDKPIFDAHVEGARILQHQKDNYPVCSLKRISCS